MHALIFQQWVASLAGRDRTRVALQGNFEDLFLSLKCEGLILESAYAFLVKVIEVVELISALVKNVFKKMKTRGGMFATEKEFEESWRKDIAEKANIAFFESFPIEVKEEEPEDPVLFGSMTAKEYKAQRKHADAYPRLDTA